MSNIVGVTISGLDAIREEINPNRVQKQVALALGQASIYAHSRLRSEVFSRWAFPKSLDTVRVGTRSRSIQTQGKAFLSADLQYYDIPVNLAKYQANSFWGNIPPLPKKRPGLVQQVKVKRTRGIQTVMGRYGYGGFIPIGRNFMLERLTKSRFPIKLVYGLSLGQMVKILSNDTNFMEDLTTKTMNIILEGLSK